MDAKMQPQNVPKMNKDRSKNGPKSIRNRSEIDAKMMMGSKMVFWRHLGLPKPPKMEFGKPPRATSPFGASATGHRGV